MFEEFGKALIMMAGSIIIGLLGLRGVRRVKEDRVAGALDDAEVGILDRYRNERDSERARADKAVDERNKAYEEMWSLRSKVQMLTEQVELMRGTIVTLQGQIEKLIASDHK